MNYNYTKSSPEIQDLISKGGVIFLSEPKILKLGLSSKQIHIHNLRRFVRAHLHKKYSDLTNSEQAKYLDLCNAVYCAKS